MVNIVNVSVTQTIAPTPATLQATGALISQGATNTTPGTSTLLTQASSLTSILNGAKAYSTLTQGSGTATFTAASAHGFTIGDTLYITIAGATPAAYNGTFLCTVTTTTAFTYAVPSGTGGTASGTVVYTVEDVAELNAMVTTFFAQGSGLGVYVLELGAGNPSDGVTALTNYITNNPNSNYTPGAAGYFYSYLVPRTWDGTSSFIAFLASFEATTSQTYFFITTTLTNYALYTSLMKCAFTLIESPAIGVYTGQSLSTLTYSGGLATATTPTNHGVAVGQWFQITGCTPTGYNGWWQAVTGTTGSTLVWAISSNPGAESVLGSLVANQVANTGIPATEFSAAAAFWTTLNYNPSPINLVTPTAFSEVAGVTPFPTRGFSSLLATLKSAFVNVIGTGAEGGISNTLLLWGTTEDGHDFTYWYSVDWVQINLNINVSNAVINGSNNPQNPLYYDQHGINRLLAVVKNTMLSAVAFGLSLSNFSASAVPFTTYVLANPSNYPAGIYNGLSVSYTPNRGFIQITVYVNVTSFPAGS